MTLEITYRDGRTELRPVTKVRYSFVDGIQNICYEYEKDNAGETRLTIDDISQIRITPETSKYTSIKLGGRSPFEKWERFNKIVKENEDKFSIYIRQLGTGLPCDPLSQSYALVVKQIGGNRYYAIKNYSTLPIDEEIVVDDAKAMLGKLREIIGEDKQDEHGNTGERDACGDKEDK